MKVSHRNSDLSDKELLEKYRKSGDLELLGILYQRYMHLVYRVCLKYFKDRDQSQDAVMQLFEQLITSLRKHEVENLKSWLHVTARNLCLMELRKRKPQTSLENISEINMESDDYGHHDNEKPMEEDLSKLENCIEKLKVDQKQCVSLFYLEQKSYVEVAEQTSFPLKKVKSYIQNGKRNLKICMELDE